MVTIYMCHSEKKLAFTSDVNKLHLCAQATQNFSSEYYRAHQDRITQLVASYALSAW